MSSIPGDGDENVHRVGGELSVIQQRMLQRCHVSMGHPMKPMFARASSSGSSATSTATLVLGWSDHGVGDPPR